MYGNCAWNLVNCAIITFFPAILQNKIKIPSTETNKKMISTFLVLSTNRLDRTLPSTGVRSIVRSACWKQNNEEWLIRKALRKHHYTHTHANQITKMAWCESGQKSSKYTTTLKKLQICSVTDSTHKMKMKRSYKTPTLKLKAMKNSMSEQN